MSLVDIIETSGVADDQLLLTIVWETLVDAMQKVGLELLFCLVAIGIGTALRGLRKTAFPPARSGSIGKTSSASSGKGLAPRAPAGIYGGGAGPLTLLRPQRPQPESPLSLEQLVERTLALRLPTAAALAQYLERRALGQHFHFEAELARLGSRRTAFDFYAALVQCAGRAGRPQLLVELLDDMAAVGIARTLPLYESAMKLLAGKKCYTQALMVFDRMSSDQMEPSPITLSCLVGFAVELGEADRAVEFFERLAAREVPSIRAYMTIFRVFSQRKDWLSAKKLLRGMHVCGAEVDSLVMNMVLATGVAAGKVDDAAALLDEELWRSVADVVSYNIILKGFAQQGKTSKALAMLESMGSHGVEQNLISYNTAIDASARGLRSEDAWRLYSEMREKPAMKPDKCTCSTLVKTLQRDATKPRVEAALQLLEDVLSECSVDLAGRLLAGTLEAALEVQDVALSAKAFALRERVGGANDIERVGLAILAAKTGDAVACAAAWKRAGAGGECGELAELASIKANVEAAVASGDDLCVSTLRALAAPASRVAERSEAAAKRARPTPARRPVAWVRT